MPALVLDSVAAKVPVSAEARGLARDFCHRVGHEAKRLNEQAIDAPLRRRIARYPDRMLLVHGTDDTRLPFPSMTQAEMAPRAVGVPVETLACVGTEHSIDQGGLVCGGLFLQQMLSMPAH
jgi:hypothetical protein